MTEKEPVTVEQREAVQVITINRPAARNAVDASVARGSAALDELDSDDGLRVGILTGAGGFFSAGMDLKAFLRGESPSRATAASRASCSARPQSR